MEIDDKHTYTRSSKINVMLILEQMQIQHSAKL
jgi:hypothetical protein